MNTTVETKSETWLLISLAAALVSAACGGSGNPPAAFDVDGGVESDGGSEKAPSAPTGATTGSGESGSFGGSDGGEASNKVDECSDAAKLIYVLSTDNNLYSFSPLAKAFVRIGALGCKAPDGQLPNSMAIDRNAIAYVNYTGPNFLRTGDGSGTVFKVSTKDASCLGQVMPLPRGWFRLGMGYSTEAAGSSDETLFVAATDRAGGGLGQLDAASKRIVPIGGFSGDLRGQRAELTGTGDGRLFGFFTTTPVRVAQLDKKTASTIGTPATIAGLETPFAFAFSFWGGDFYLYSAPDPAVSPSRTTNVTRYRPTDGTSDTAYMTNVGFRIVGAGVSTCAPVSAPR